MSIQTPWNKGIKTGLTPWNKGKTGYRIYPQKLDENNWLEIRQLILEGKSPRMIVDMGLSNIGTKSLKKHLLERFPELSKFIVYKNKTYKKLRVGGAAFNGLYGNYRRQANKRGYAFTLSPIQFKGLTQERCRYCNREPFAVHRATIGTNGGFKYNGIDRLDNTKGYTLENSVPCCKVCNIMKQRLTEQEFINHISIIYLNHKERNNANGK